MMGAMFGRNRAFRNAPYITVGDMERVDPLEVDWIEREHRGGTAYASIRGIVYDTRTTLRSAARFLLDLNP